MKNIFKFKKIMITSLVATLLLCTGISSFAKNSTDTGYSFYFTTSPMAVTKYSEKRAKEDTSSSYVNLKSGKNLSSGVIFSIVGSNYQGVGSRRVTLKAPACAFLTQNAYENRVYSVRLKGEKSIRESYVQAFGVWSPDSTPQGGCKQNNNIVDYFE